MKRKEENVRKRTWMTALLALALVTAGLGVWAQDEGMANLDPLLKILVQNKVITLEQAQAVQAEYAKQKAQDTAVIKEDVKNQVSADMKKSGPKLPSALEGLRIGGLYYVSYQNGQKYLGVKDETSTWSQFTLKRGYIDIQKDITPFLVARATPDVTQDATGDWKVRLKYLYGKFHWKGNDFITNPYLEVGLSHMPWLDYEESINLYRMQDTMFLERNNIFNSADVGVMFGADFGGQMPDDYKKKVSSHYAGKYGSMQVGLYNGTGYHASEKNHNKVLEYRFSVRPLPAILPGLQVTYMGLQGKPNVAQPQPGPTSVYPDWRLNDYMVSYQHRYFTLTGQWADGKNNQGGSAVWTYGPDLGDSLRWKGYSYFGEFRFPFSGSQDGKWSLIARYDRFDPNRDEPNAAEKKDIQKRTIFGAAWQFAKGNYLLADYETLQHSKAWSGQPAGQFEHIPDEKRFQLTLQMKF
jgi:hypothetical protein